MIDVDYHYFSWCQHVARPYANSPVFRCHRSYKCTPPADGNASMFVTGVRGFDLAHFAGRGSISVYNGYIRGATLFLSEAASIEIYERWKDAASWRPSIRRRFATAHRCVWLLRKSRPILSHIFLMISLIFLLVGYFLFCAAMRPIRYR